MANAAVLERFLDRLADNYNKTPGGNVYKMAQLSTDSIQENEEALQLIEDWLDIDQAQGATLDLHGRDVGQERGQATDDVYRVLIKSKIKRNLSDGSINAIIDFLSFVLQCDPKEINVRELWRDFYSPNLIGPFNDPSWTLYNKATSLNNFVGKIKTETLNFVGKVSGSVVDNPHTAKRTATAGSGSTSLVTPSSGGLIEFESVYYSQITSLNGTVTNINSITNSGGIAQQIFSFNLIEMMKRKYGMTVDVAWLLANVKNLAFNWHGYGSGPNGNKAYVTGWANNSAWYNTPATHASGSISKLTFQNASAGMPYISSDGYAHFICYTDAASSTVASTINTDYVELVVDIGGVAFNPNKAYAHGGSTSLVAPSGTWAENTTQRYDQIKALDGSVSNYGFTSVSGQIAQQLFSFDLIGIIERRYNTTIPGANTAAKVTWLKANVTKLTCNWHGFGSGPSGNKAYLYPWRVDNSSWWAGYSLNHGASTVTKLSRSMSGADMTLTIDANGFVHWLACADAATTIASTINTDYIELIVEANVVPGVTVSDAVIDPINPYKLILSATTTGEYSMMTVNVKPNTDYTLQCAHNGRIAVYKDGATIISPYTGAQEITFNSGSSSSVLLFFSNDALGAGVYAFTNPQLEKGPTKTDFKPKQTDFVSGAATLHIDAPAEAVSHTGLSINQFGALINLVVAGGVKAEVLFQGTFEFGSVGEAADPAKGLADVGQTSGGTLGTTYDPANDYELPI